MAKSNLLTAEAVEEFAMCEGCGNKHLRKDLPSGWSQCGRSRKRILSTGSGEVTADWCPSCEFTSYSNPTPADVFRIKKELSRKAVRP